VSGTVGKIASEVDPAADLALVVLTDRDFGDWAKPLWPALSGEVLREFTPD